MASSSVIFESLAPFALTLVTQILIAGGYYLLYRSQVSVEEEALYLETLQNLGTLGILTYEQFLARVEAINTAEMTLKNAGYSGTAIVGPLYFNPDGIDIKIVANGVELIHVKK